MELPRGVPRGRGWTCEAWLRPLTGADEAFLQEEAAGLAPVERSSALLARTLVRLGTSRTVTREVIGSLTLGDRDALMLHLRASTLGPGIDAVLVCPSAGCGQRMDLELPVSDLLLPPYPERKRTYRTVIKTQGSCKTFRFRLPTVEDQEKACLLASNDAAAAAELILKNCLLGGVDGEAADRVDEVTPTERLALARAMAELDPQAEIRLNLKCPECGSPFDFVFDPVDFFFRELADDRQRLYREVHLLALHYHWSEREILDLTRNKRRLYLGLLAETWESRRSGISR